MILLFIRRFQKIGWQFQFVKIHVSLSIRLYVVVISFNSNTQISNKQYNKYYSEFTGLVSGQKNVGKMQCTIFTVQEKKTTLENPKAQNLISLLRETNSVSISILLQTSRRIGRDVTTQCLLCWRDYNLQCTPRNVKKKNALELTVGRVWPGQWRQCVVCEWWRCVYTVCVSVCDSIAGELFQRYPAVAQRQPQAKKIPLERRDNDALLRQSIVATKRTGILSGPRYQRLWRLSPFVHYISLTLRRQYDALSRKSYWTYYLIRNWNTYFWIGPKYLHHILSWFIVIYPFS